MKPKLKRVLLLVGVLSAAVVLGTMVWFYFLASAKVKLIKPEQIGKINRPIRVLITAGTIEKMKRRLAPLKSINPGPNITVQINLDRMDGHKEALEEITAEKWNSSIYWCSIPIQGTIWEIQQGLQKARQNRELLVIPMVKVRAFKIVSVVGDIERIRVISLPAGLPQKMIEFLKSYLGWIAPGLVIKYRNAYYDYED